jgi:predicted nucleotidyltransferase component of viral defense system
MNHPVFDQMMLRYSMNGKEDDTNALREVIQQITLSGLYRAGFFDKAAFYGGTCLRIFYGLQRFSEDMDFSLLRSNEHFLLENYFEPIISEFKALGRDIIINKKEKQTQTNIESAFLKDNTAIYNIRFRTERKVKIKIEVDIDPPTGFNTEHKLLLLPFSFMTRCYILSDLYAGKMHALLFRNWKNRVKGRDWYDFEWYVRNNVSLDFEHFCKRTAQSGSLNGEKITYDFFIQLLKKRIKNTNLEMVKSDVRPFIKNPAEIEIWSTDYFLQLADRIIINSTEN